MVRHGRIDPSDKKLLEKGNPHLDEDWRNEYLPGVGEQFRDISFSAVYCGNLYRSVETLQTLITSSGLLKLWFIDEFLDDPSTYHDGVVYPNILPSFTTIMDSIPSYFQDIARRHKSNAKILMVGGGAEIISMIALSRGLKFQDEEEAQSWVVKEVMDQKVGLIETGSIHSFFFNPHSRKLMEVSLEKVRNVSRRRI
jgi:hypothetical protein